MKQSSNAIVYFTTLLMLWFLITVGGLPCLLEGILASPVVNGYRNKCEFSVGQSLQGKTTVGFMLGNFRYFTFYRNFWWFILALIFYFFFTE